MKRKYPGSRGRGSIHVNGRSLCSEQKITPAANQARQVREPVQQGDIIGPWVLTFIVHKRSVFACALVYSPERMADQTACPEESPARARNRCGTEDRCTAGLGKLSARLSLPA